MQATPYETIGGDKAVRQLVLRFYELMDTLPEANDIRQMHPEDLSTSTDKLYKFLSGWLGGPSLYIEQYGHPKLRQRHLPFAIDTKERDQWLMCMYKAMEECHLDEAVQSHLKLAFHKLADHMRNQSAI